MSNLPIHPTLARLAVQTMIKQLQELGVTNMEEVKAMLETELRARILGCAQGSRCVRWLDDERTSECQERAAGTVLVGMSQQHPNAEFGAPAIAPAPACEDHLTAAQEEGYQVCRDMYGQDS